VNTRSFIPRFSQRCTFSFRIFSKFGQCNSVWTFMSSRLFDAGYSFIPQTHRFTPCISRRFTVAFRVPGKGTWVNPRHIFSLKACCTLQKSTISRNEVRVNNLTQNQIGTNSHSGRAWQNKWPSLFCSKQIVSAYSENKWIDLERIQICNLR
jgi:hypothetical protein